MHLWVFNSVIRVLLLCPFWCTLNYYLNQCTIVERCLWVTIRYHRHLGFLWLEGGRNVRHPIRETSSDANHPGTRAHGRFGPLIHCGLIRRLKEWNWCARADLPLKKKKKKAQARVIRRTFTCTPPIEETATQTRYLTCAMVAVGVTWQARQALSLWFVCSLFFFFFSCL